MARKFWRSDYAVTIDGELVCVGDVEFVAETLGLKVNTVRFYAGADPIQYLKVERLPPLWAVIGHKGMFTAEQAAAILGCDPAQVGRRKETRRANRPAGRKPLAEIDRMLYAAKDRYNRSRRRA